MIVVSHHFTSSTALIRSKNFGKVILGLMGSNLKVSNMEKLWQYFGFYWHSPGNSGSDPVYLLLKRNMYLYVFSVIVIVCLLFQQQTVHVQLTELQVVNDGQVLTAHRLMLLLRYSVTFCCENDGLDTVSGPCSARHYHTISAILRAPINETYGGILVSARRI